ncbi:hypothetical protein B0H12DRAFT_513867 [Mycena haematopus]|nr:hypothetical protein B0H12DRAFT_513867 [Mycena haematopus]
MFVRSEILFAGSAVYIFGIDQVSSEADIAFTLGDIQHVHHYTGPGTVTSSGTDQFVYHALFFSATGLPSDQTQTVEWVFNLDESGPGLQIGLFDYAIVTTGEEDAPNPPPPSSTYIVLSASVSRTEFMQTSPAESNSRQLKGSVTQVSSVNSKHFTGINW